jgi:hypothetical protein
MDNSLTPKQLKMQVCKSIAQDPSLSDRITQVVGFTPLWSRMTVEQLMAVQLAWQLLTQSEGEEE